MAVVKKKAAATAAAEAPELDHPDLGTDDSDGAPKFLDEFESEEAARAELARLRGIEGQFGELRAKHDETVDRIITNRAPAPVPRPAVKADPFRDLDPNTMPDPIENAAEHKAWLNKFFGGVKNAYGELLREHEELRGQVSQSAQSRLWDRAEMEFFEENDDLRAYKDHLVTQAMIELNRMDEAGREAVSRDPKKFMDRVGKNFRKAFAPMFEGGEDAGGTDAAPAARGDASRTQGTTSGSRSMPRVKRNDEQPRVSFADSIRNYQKENRLN